MECAVVQRLGPDVLDEEKEIGDLAVWNVSTAKPGNGVDMLRDGKEDTYWQSDGGQPHRITLHFQRQVTVSKVAMQMDYRLDESYTPRYFRILCGSRWSDVKNVRNNEVVKPQGWVIVPLKDHEGGGEDGNNNDKKKIRKGVNALILQIEILSNHQNGRDSHVRQLHVFGPREEGSSGVWTNDVGWSTVDATMYSTVR